MKLLLIFGFSQIKFKAAVIYDFNYFNRKSLCDLESLKYIFIFRFKKAIPVSREFCTINGNRIQSDILK